MMLHMDIMSNGDTNVKYWEIWFMCFCFRILNSETKFKTILILSGARGGAVGWGTALQVGRSRVRFRMVSLEFFIYIILPAALWPWDWLSLYQKWICRLSWNLGPSDSWNPQGLSRPIMGLLYVYLYSLCTFLNFRCSCSHCTFCHDLRSILLRVFARLVTLSKRQVLIEMTRKIALILRRLMSYIYGAPILDVSRSHTTTQHSR